MARLPLLLLCMAAVHSASAFVRLTAVANPGGGSVRLQWHMVDYNSTTAYVLMKSVDGISWEVAAANPAMRKYTAATILAYTDKVTDVKQLHYRVRIYDRHDNTVALSNTALVELPDVKSPAILRQATDQGNGSQGEKNLWKIYPNPVGDLLVLNYVGKQRIMGVINIQVIDGVGKIVIRFRQASNNQQIRIPVNKLKKGIYFIRVDILNEIQLKGRFVKE